MQSLKADMIVSGGPIYTALGQAKAEAVAIHAGKIVAAGKAADLDGLAGSGTRRIDLRGRSAIPAFNDCHLHTISLGLSLSEVNLSPSAVRNIDDMIAAIRAQAAKMKPGEWILGGRYDHFELAEKRHPSMQELDQAAPDNPVYIKRRCGHVGVGNSRAFALAKITDASPDPAGGHIEKRDGKLTGQLQENAQNLVFSIVPDYSMDELIDAIEVAGKHMLERGVASVMDAGIGMRQGVDDMAAFQLAYRDGRLPVRTYLAVLGGPDGIIDECASVGMITGVGDDYLKVGPAKLFADGSAGGRTAAMTTPYLNDGDNKGLFIYSDNELNAMVNEYYDMGYQLATHAIGDAAIEQVLNAYENAISTGRRPPQRHRIEHCGFIHPHQNERMQRLGIIPVPQPCFFRHFSDLYASVLGDEWTNRSYPLRTWVEMGLRPASSTDTPVCPPDALPNLASILDRRGPSGKVYGADQTLDIDTAIETMTYNGAFAENSEHIKGRLQPGQLADVTIVDRDIFGLSADEIAAANVDFTIVGGAVAYDRLGEIA